MHIGGRGYGLMNRQDTQVPRRLATGNPSRRPWRAGSQAFGGAHPETTCLPARPNYSLPYTLKGRVCPQQWSRSQRGVAGGGR